MTAVSVTIPHKRGEVDTTTRPAHHLNSSGTSFTNPWSSFRSPGFKNLFKAAIHLTQPPIPPNLNQLIGFKTPDWGAGTDSGKIKATWLGHACFLVELPTPLGASRGPRILFDPVFSHRCSPVQWAGPARFTEPPCSLSQVPEFDAVVYSHNHYDHMDKETLRELMAFNATSSPRIHVFAPLNNDALFKSLSIPPTHFHCLDWWSSRLISVSLPSVSEQSGTVETPSPVPTTFRLTCTPCQHFSGRGILDRYSTLWSSWAVEADASDNLPEHADTPDLQTAPLRMGGDGAKLWFGGDTGYRTVHDGEDENEVPVCPVFKEIGERFGGFDLALIPIGAYLPRYAFSSWHCAPQDSVRVFADVKARKAIGMHWGTWSLTNEDIMAPAELLVEECAKAGIPEGTFGVCGIGHTVVA